MNIARSMLLKYFVSKWTVMITSAGMLATMMYHLSSGQLDKVHHMYTILSAVYFLFFRGKALLTIPVMCGKLFTILI